MRYFHKQQNHFWKPVINLDKVHTYSKLSRAMVESIGRSDG